MNYEDEPDWLATCLHCDDEGCDRCTWSSNILTWLFLIALVTGILAIIWVGS